MKKTARNIYLGFILFLMYAPIATLVVLSFNSSKSRSKWGGFTLKWYSSLFQDDAIMSALYNTLAIAFLSALIATIIGTCASLGITAMKAKWRTVFSSIKSAICAVRRSCTCGRRAKQSTIRANLESPMILPSRGIYAI